MEIRGKCDNRKKIENQVRGDCGGDLTLGSFKNAWREDMRSSRKIAFGVPTCTLDSGPADVFVMRC